MAFYCRACGLVLYNGFCLHASVAEADKQAKKRK
jgi:hypothetical protein